MKKVSIVVPVYNVEKYLDKCVSSLVNQTYTNLEIILVDDSSPDNSPKMCDEWAKKDSRIKVIHKKNGGVSSSRNAGIDASSGNYLLFVDSDDYITSDCVQYLVDKMESGNADGVMYYMQAFYENGKIGSTWSAPVGEYDIEKEYDFYKFFIEKVCVHFLFHSVCAQMFKTEIIKNNNIRFDLRHSYAEDFQFATVYYSYCKKYIVTDKIFYYYLQARAGSTCSENHKNHEYHIDGITEICKYTNNELKQNNKLADIDSFFPYLYAMIFFRYCENAFYEQQGSKIKKYIKKVPNLKEHNVIMRSVYKNLNSFKQKFGSFMYLKGHKIMFRYIVHYNNVFYKWHYFIRHFVEQMVGKIKGKNHG